MSKTHVPHDTTFFPCYLNGGNFILFFFFFLDCKRSHWKSIYKLFKSFLRQYIYTEPLFKQIEELCNCFQDISGPKKRLFSRFFGIITYYYFIKLPRFKVIDLSFFFSLTFRLPRFQGAYRSQKTGITRILYHWLIIRKVSIGGSVNILIIRQSKG